MCDVAGKHGLLSLDAGGHALIFAAQPHSTSCADGGTMHSSKRTS